MAYICAKCGYKSSQRVGVQEESAQLNCLNCGHVFDSALLNTRKRLRSNPADDEPIITIHLKIFIILVLAIWAYTYFVGPILR